MKKILLFFFMTFLLSGCDWMEPDIEMTLVPSNDVIAIDSNYIDPGCIITIDGEPFDMTTDDRVDTSVSSEQTITYSYTHDETEYLCYRVVKVMDLTPPVVVLNPGIDTVQIGSQHIDTGVTVEDNITMELSVETVNNVNTTEVGTYSIIYTVTDEANNTVVITRYVTVYDPENLN